MSTLNVTNISDGTNSTSTTNVVKGSAKAWVVFDGTTNTGGNCDIQDSYNVSSVEDQGAGVYTVRLSITMASDDYPVAAMAGNKTETNSGNHSVSAGVASTTSIGMETMNPSGTNGDREYCSMIIYGDVA